MKSWTTVAPVLALLLLIPTWTVKDLPTVLVVIVALVLGGAVLSAVHHAEVVAHRVGEPFGSLVLAVAVTVIEVGLIVTLMISGGRGTSELARDTVFAAVMITCNGIVGISLLVTALRQGTASFNAQGTGGALATVTTLAVLCLVLPSVTSGQIGAEFTAPQLSFAAVASLVLSAFSCSPRRSGTATTSSRSTPRARWSLHMGSTTSTPSRRPTARP